MPSRPNPEEETSVTDDAPVAATLVGTTPVKVGNPSNENDSVRLVLWRAKVTTSELMTDRETVVILPDMLVRETHRFAVAALPCRRVHVEEATVLTDLPITVTLHPPVDTAFVGLSTVGVAVSNENAENTVV